MFDVFFGWGFLFGYYVYGSFESIQMIFRFIIFKNYIMYVVFIFIRKVFMV